MTRRPASEPALRQLAAAMAHEVRNPLNAMVIHAELLEARSRGLPDAERSAALRSVEILRLGIERIDAILGRYLHCAGPPEVERVSVEVSALVAHAFDRVREAAEARRVELKSRVTGEMRWRIDAPSIEQAIEELLVNAVEASREGGVVRVLASLANDGAAVIEVSDEGEGIESSALPEIFQLGFSTRGRLGIGLSVVMQIVKGSGGSIIALAPEQVTGRGVTFRIELPLD